MRGNELQHVRTICDETHGDAEGLQSASQTPADAGIAEMVDYVVVMYAGRVVEKGTVTEIFKNPMHPYTIGLQKSKPVVGKEVDRLYSIPGNVPNPVNMPSTCYFKDRCNMKCNVCKNGYPPMVQVSPTHYVACYLALKEGLSNG